MKKKIIPLVLALLIFSSGVVVYAATTLFTQTSNVDIVTSSGTISVSKMDYQINSGSIQSCGSASGSSGTCSFSVNESSIQIANITLTDSFSNTGSTQTISVSTTGLCSGYELDSSSPSSIIVPSGSSEQVIAIIDVSNATTCSGITTVLS
jgi:hypothetical protein